MKKDIVFLLVCILAGGVLTGCKKKEDVANQRQLIVGYWKLSSANEYMRLMNDDSEKLNDQYLGYEWNADEGTVEDDLWQESMYHGNSWFKWYIAEGKKNNSLTKINLVTFGGYEVEKTYTITKLTETTLVLDDDHGEKTYIKTSKP